MKKGTDVSPPDDSIPNGKIFIETTNVIRGLTVCKRKVTIIFVAKVSLQIDVPDLLAFSEAAEILGVSRPAVYAMIESGRLHRVNLGDSGFVLRAEVEKMKKAKMAEAGVAAAPASE